MYALLFCFPELCSVFVCAPFLLLVLKKKCSLFLLVTRRNEWIYSKLFAKAFNFYLLSIELRSKAETREGTIEVFFSNCAWRKRIFVSSNNIMRSFQTSWFELCGYIPLQQILTGWMQNMTHEPCKSTEDDFLPEPARAFLEPVFVPVPVSWTIENELGTSSAQRAWYWRRFSMSTPQWVHSKTVPP